MFHGSPQDSREVQYAYLTELRTPRSGVAAAWSEFHAVDQANLGIDLEVVLGAS